MKANCSVLAVYENAEARKMIVQFCDRLVRRFWSEFSFGLKWFDWAQLEEQTLAQQATAEARAADLIIMATAPKGKLLPEVRSWLEQALVARSEREGVLVGLPEPENELAVEAASTQVYLRKLAHRTGMDYLTDVPQSLPICEPESAEAYHQRANQVTSVMDKILHHLPLPQRLP